MFAKVFDQIFNSSIAEDYSVRHVFMDLLVLADKDGVVDMTPEAICRRTNVPLEIIKNALEKLTSPDDRSRSHHEDGKRLILVDSHRDWGWQIVNYTHYRNVVDDESRRAYFRDRQREYRSKLSKDVKDNSICQTLSKEITQAEAEAEAYTEVIHTPLPPKRGKRIATTIPEDFQITEKHLSWAREHEILNPEKYVERFRLHYLANGKTMKNWDAAFYNWITSPYQHGNNGNGRGAQSAEELQREISRKLGEALR
jgi:hypothetical protein